MSVSNVCNATTMGPTTELTCTYQYAFAALVCMFLWKIAQPVFYDEEDSSIDGDYSDGDSSSDDNENSSDGDESSDDNEDSSARENTKRLLYKKLIQIKTNLDDISATVDQICDHIAEPSVVAQSRDTPKISLSISSDHRQPHGPPTPSPLLQKSPGAAVEVSSWVEETVAAEAATHRNPPVQRTCGGDRCRAITRAGRPCRQNGDGGGGAIINGLCDYHNKHRCD
jgi:hypothetical protein